MIINIEDPVSDGLHSTLLIHIELKNGSKVRFGYRFLNQFQGMSTSSADPCLIASIFLIMACGENVVINGVVSPSLLENLDRFQEIWACWKPGFYNHVDISASTELEQPNLLSKSSSILFSGGVDSAFATLKHLNNDMRRANKNIQFGVVVKGMGGFQDQAESRFEIELEDLTKIAESKKLDLITVQSDWQYVMQNMGFDIYEIFSAGFISCLHLFRNVAGNGIIGSTDNTRDYKFEMPSPSNPFTDTLLSTNFFKIHNEGSAFSRVQKIRYLASWREYIDHLRVCNMSNRYQRNCGKCEKCIRTSLSFHVAGLDTPSDLLDPHSCDIESIRIVNKVVRISIEHLLADARAANLQNENWYIRLTNHMGIQS